MKVEQIYHVVEIFVSINGEGTKAGQLATFVRFRGCNLHCSFCDTRWACEEDAKARTMTGEEILAELKEYAVTNVTLTGGEPLLREGMKELITLLCQSGFQVEIETNGSVDLTPYLGITNGPSFTMDYKLPGSGMEKAMRVENFSLLTEADTVKFVVGSKEDLERAREVIEKFELKEKCRTYLSPVFGKIQPEDIVEYMKLHCMNQVTMQLQMHKIIWDPDARGV